MKKLTLNTASGKSYSVEMPSPTSGYRSAYAFAFPKSGSTLMNDLLLTYCGQVGIAVVSLFDQAFSQGVLTADIGDETHEVFKDEGYLYVGFRRYPSFSLNLHGRKTILLTRDPRDMLVSRYYSVTKSHVIPEGQVHFAEKRKRASSQTIDEFVLGSTDLYVRALARYRDILKGSDLAVYRYEDVIYDKLNWLERMLVHLDIEFDLRKASEVVSRFDVFPEQERIDHHIRQVHPGNYKQKLKQETIEQLNEQLAEFLRYFGYSTKDIAE